MENTTQVEGQVQDPVVALEATLAEREQEMANLVEEFEAIENPTDEQSKAFRRQKNLMTGSVNTARQELEAARAKVTAEQKPSKAKGGLPRCPMTGKENKPGSRFSPGMDARLKGMIGRVEKNMAEPGFEFPELVLEYARTMPDQMWVGPYNANYILEMHEKLQRGEGFKPPKPEKTETKPEATAEAEAEKEPVGAAA